jgi:hypothetical protein
MKWRLGSVPENPNFQPEKTGWSKIKEPGSILMQIMALPVGVLLVIANEYVLVQFTNIWDTNLHPVAFLPFFVAVIVLHESTHLLFFPDHGRTISSMVGFWPSRLLFYAHFTDEISRNRYLAISLGPFVLLTVIPLLTFVLIGYVDSYLYWFIIFNAAASSCDVFSSIIILLQIPRRGLVRNQGFRTWYRN